MLLIQSTVHPKSSTDGAIPAYLGLVSVLEDLAIYAMVTSTKLKILLILRPGEARIKDIDCLTVCDAWQCRNYPGLTFFGYLPDPASDTYIVPVICK